MFFNDQNECTNDRHYNIAQCTRFTEGYLKVNSSLLMSYTWRDLDVMFPDVDIGGHWRPVDCAPRRRIAILIPLRDRESHLVAFLAHTHPILQRQKTEYQIFVVEQVIFSLHPQYLILSSVYYM